VAREVEVEPVTTDQDWPLVAKLLASNAFGCRSRASGINDATSATSNAPRTNHNAASTIVTALPDRSNEPMARTYQGAAALRQAEQERRARESCPENINQFFVASYEPVHIANNPQPRSLRGDDRTRHLRILGLILRVRVVLLGCHRGVGYGSSPRPETDMRSLTMATGKHLQTS
jgi:hypothetical protein